MAKDLIFKDRPPKSSKKETVVQYYERDFDDDLPPVIDLKLYDRLLPTDTLMECDEFWYEQSKSWIKTKAAGNRATNPPYYRRPKWVRNVKDD